MVHGGWTVFCRVFFLLCFSMLRCKIVLLIILIIIWWKMIIFHTCLFLSLQDFKRKGDILFNYIKRLSLCS